MGTGTGSIYRVPGAAGVVEGTARVLSAPEDGAQLGDGDTVVTAVTNIGWTPIFPRAGAVVTDVGAPLSRTPRSWPANSASPPSSAAATLRARLRSERPDPGRRRREGTVEILDRG